MRNKAAALSVSLALVFTLNMFAARAAQATDAPTCPIVADGETELDCPWAGIARSLIATSRENPGAANGHVLQQELIKQVPGFKKDFQLDRSLPTRELWGHSLNFDEYAKVIIIEPAILETVSQSIGVPSPAAPVEGVNGMIAHAGAQHTYGYLFSVEKTAFGFKRARWVREDIEAGFGFPRGTVGPTPKKGSLFTNVSYLLARLSMQDDRHAHSIANVVAPMVPKQLRNYAFSKLEAQRLEERVEIGSRVITIRTDFFRFPNPPAVIPSAPAPNSQLLVYSIRDTEDHNHVRVISAFPVAESFAAGVFAANLMGDNQPIVTKYNAFVAGLTGKTIVGSRKRSTLILK